MVAARISRQSAEVAADAGAPAGVSRVDVEVAGKATEATASVAARISRQSAEVAAPAAQVAGISRVDVEVAGKATEATTAIAARVSRISAEIAINISPRTSIARLDVEVAGRATEASVVAAQVSRISGEAAARRGSAGVVAPLALNADAELFMHDWADECVLRSSYLTDVALARTGAESRTGRRLKPARSMDIVWRQSREEFDAANSNRLDRLYVFMRRLTGDRFAVPLYPDQRVIETALLSTDDQVPIDTSIGRWTVGARVAVVQLDYRGSYASHTFHLIEAVDGTFVRLTAALGVDVAAYSIVVPMIDCEVALEARIVHPTSCLAEVTVTVDEVPGASQLPPTRSDTPAGVPTHLGIPIFDLDPDWTDGVGRGRLRQGEEFDSGRARGVSVEAARSREYHELSFTNERSDYWRLIEFFDTRRGRLRTLWHIDQENVWTAAQLDLTFVSVEQFGDLADFQEELEGFQVGLVMSNGDFYVRDAVTVQQVATVYRITVSPDLPAGLDAADVIRVARARLVRFDSDELQERWSHSGLAQSEVRFLETLEDQDIEL